MQGRLVSDMTEQKEPSGSIIDFNETLRLAVNDSTLQVNQKVPLILIKCAIAIYIRRGGKEKRIIGMVNIKFEEAHYPSERNIPF